MKLTAAEIITHLKTQLQTQQPLYINVKVIPNAPQNQYTDILEDGSIKIKINAVPENNKANLTLITFLSKSLNFPKSSISIVNGHKSRHKLVKINNSSPCN